MRSTLALLSLAASAFAYSVTEPSQTSSWTTLGPNVVTWNRVNTDATNFTLVLVNQDKSILSSGSEILIAYVDGSAGTITPNPPSGGYPAGNGFQVNLVQDSNNLNTIYAQSGQFNIVQSTTSASSTTSSSSSTGSVSASKTTGTSSSKTTGTSSSKTTGTSASSGSSGSASGTSSDLNPSSTGSSSAAGRVEGGLVAVFAAALGALAL